MSNTTNQPTNVMANPTTPTQEINVMNKPKLKANMDTLAMTPREFADYAQAKGDEAIARGESYKRAIIAAGWELRLAVGNKRKDIENLIALNYVKALRPLKDSASAPAPALKAMQTATATPAQVMEVQQKLFAQLPEYADIIEKLYSQYAEHSYVIVAKTEWDFELHPFTRQISFAQQADAQEASHETVSLEEINKEFALDDLDADEYDDEYQAAFAAWGANSEMSQVMNQSDKKNHKENHQINTERTASGDINTRVKPTYENIDRAGWIEDYMARDYSEWLDAASWGARTANLAILTKALRRTPALRELLVERKQEDELTPKTLGSMTNRFRTQEIVLDVKMDSLREYLFHALRADEDGFFNTGIQMPQNDRLVEAQATLVEMENHQEALQEFNPKLWENETFMIRDVEKYGEAKSLSLWRTFNLWDEVMTSLNKADRAMLEKVGTSAYYNPDLENGTNTGLEFWSIDLNFKAERTFRVRVAAAVGQASLRNYHTESGKAGKLAAEKYLAGLANDNQSTAQVDSLIDSLIG